MSSKFGKCPIPQCCELPIPEIPSLDLDDLTDVDTTGVVNNDILIYNGGTSIWETGAPPALPIGTNWSDYLYWDPNPAPGAWKVDGNKIHIGGFSGETGQSSDFPVALGFGAGNLNQKSYAIAIGLNSGGENQGIESTCCGNNSGAFDAGDQSVCIGDRAGETTCGQSSVSVGSKSGKLNMGDSSIAIGLRSQEENSGQNSIGIGVEASRFSSGEGSIGIGDNANHNLSGIHSIAIGDHSGGESTAPYSICIGENAGRNTISGLSNTTDASLFIGLNAAHTEVAIRELPAPPIHEYPVLLVEPVTGEIVREPNLLQYNNPRLVGYFGENIAPETIGGGNIIWLTRTNVTRLEASPSIQGAPGDPVLADGWQGDADQVLKWVGNYMIPVKIDMRVNVGRQTPQEMDCALYVELNGTEITGALSSGSIGRSPISGQGSTELTSSCFLEINPNDELGLKMRRIGVDAAVIRPINIYSAYFSIVSTSNKRMNVDIFP